MATAHGIDLEAPFNQDEAPVAAAAVVVPHSRRRRILTFIAVVAMGAEVAHEYAALRATLEKKGDVIGNNDLWIAAHARAAGLILVTNNEREFKRVPGLKMQNWAT